MKSGVFGPSEMWNQICVFLSLGRIFLDICKFGELQSLESAVESSNSFSLCSEPAATWIWSFKLFCMCFSWVLHLVIRKKHLLLTRTPKRIFSELSFITDIACRSGGRELDHLQVRNLVHFFICSNDDFIDRSPRKWAPSFRRFFLSAGGLSLQIVCVNCRENWTINEDEILSIGGGCFQKNHIPMSWRAHHNTDVDWKWWLPDAKSSSPSPSFHRQIHLIWMSTDLWFAPFFFSSFFLRIYHVLIFGCMAKNVLTAFFFALVSWFNLANHWWFGVEQLKLETSRYDPRREDKGLCFKKTSWENQGRKILVHTRGVYWAHVFFCFLNLLSSPIYWLKHVLEWMCRERRWYFGSSFRGLFTLWLRSCASDDLLSLQVALPLWPIAAVYVKRFRRFYNRVLDGYIYRGLWCCVTRTLRSPGASHTQYWWDCPATGDGDYTIQLQYLGIRKGHYKDSYSSSNVRECHIGILNSCDPTEPSDFLGGLPLAGELADLDCQEAPALAWSDLHRNHRCNFDGRNPAITSWYDKYPMIYRVLHTSQVVVWEFGISEPSTVCITWTQFLDSIPLHSLATSECPQCTRFQRLSWTRCESRNLKPHAVRICRFN